MPSCAKLDTAGTALGTRPEIGDKRRSRQRRSPGTVRPLAPMQLGDPERQLALIQNADGLFRWALDILPARNRMTDDRREALDAAFRTRAEHLGADELLTVLAQAAGPDSARSSDAADLRGTDASA